jgi:hypothetical protein
MEPELAYQPKPPAFFEEADMWQRMFVRDCAVCVGERAGRFLGINPVSVSTNAVSGLDLERLNR